MTYRQNRLSDDLQDAAAIVEAILKTQGEIDVSAIRSIPVVRNDRDVELILQYLRSKNHIEISRRVERTTPILNWEQIVSLKGAREPDEGELTRVPTVDSH